ncbi:MAG: LacI family transcriptional regulator [Rhodoferax sp.]|uniref:LacI family transcriptional regulator n=1 Tax=Rhodoferax sp. TaxID=50421 RepID=UPI003BAFB20F
MAKSDKGMVTGEPVTYQIPAPAGGVQMETFIPWTLVKRGVRRQVITPIDAPEHFEKEAFVERSARKQVKDSPLIRALGMAHYWQRLLDEGKYRSLTEIAAAEGMDRGQANRIYLLTRLAPEIIQSCQSDHKSGAKMEPLAKACQAVTWSDQSPMLTMGNVGSRFDS